MSLRLPHMAGKLLLLLLLPGAVSASPAAVTPAAMLPREVAKPAPSTWISVDANGSPRTITPTVAIVSGATTTVSPPPDQLTRTQTWLLSLSGTASQSTGPAPVATATGTGVSSKEGVMLACSNYVGEDGPFCQPKRGSLLNPGTTYYITWDPTRFADPNEMIKVQANYDNFPSQLGWSSPELRADQGFYIWAIPPTLLDSRPNKAALNATFYINYQAENSSDFNEIRSSGPRVTITLENGLVDDGLSRGGSSGPSVAAVVVPVVLVLAVAALLGFCFWSWRKRGVVPGAAAVAAMRRRSSGFGGGGGGGGSGYGVRRSWSERVGGGAGQGQQGQQQQGLPRYGAGMGATATGAGDRLPDDKLPSSGIQLTDRDSWSPTSPSSGGRNVFREEIQRQETGRR